MWEKYIYIFRYLKFHQVQWRLLTVEWRDSTKAGITNHSFRLLVYLNLHIVGVDCILLRGALGQEISFGADAQGKDYRTSSWT